MRFIYTILIFSVVMCAYSQDLTDSIVVRKAPWFLLTDSDVSCYNFEDCLHFQEYSITDKKMIESINKVLQKLKPSRSQVLNVRCKLYFYSSDSLMYTLCIDPKSSLIEGNLYKTPSRLLRVIDKITDCYAPSGGVSTKTRHSHFFPFPNGRDSLYQFISQQNQFIKYVNDSISLGVLCKIDKEGNTINVVVKNLGRENQVLFDDLKINLCELFLKEIKWIPNKERYPYESIVIPIKIYGNVNTKKKKCRSEGQVFD